MYRLVEVRLTSPPPYLPEKRLQQSNPVRDPLSLWYNSYTRYYLPDDIQFVRLCNDLADIAPALPTRKTALAVEPGKQSSVPLVKFIY